MAGEPDVVTALLNGPSDSGLGDLLRADWRAAGLPVSAAADDATAREQLEVADRRLDQLVRTSAMRHHVEKWSTSDRAGDQQADPTTVTGRGADDTPDRPRDLWQPAADQPSTVTMADTIASLTTIRDTVRAVLNGRAGG